MLNMLMIGAAFIAEEMHLAYRLLAVVALAGKLDCCLWPVSQRNFNVKHFKVCRTSAMSHIVILQITGNKKPPHWAASAVFLASCFRRISIILM